jgi:hypothetical protein
MARELHDQANSQYGDKEPIKFVEKDPNDILPPLQDRSRCTKSVSSLQGSRPGPMNKYVKKNHLPVDIAATVPRASLIENFVAKQSAQAPIVVQPAYHKSNAVAARSMRNDMVKDYLNTKAQLEKI